MFSYWAKPKDGEYISQFLNDHIAGVVEKFPKRFVGLGTLPLQDPALSVKEVIENREAQLLIESVGLRNDF
jgi:aminocarboxymuconate-semialdehyde decarboxylase